MRKQEMIRFLINIKAQIAKLEPGIKLKSKKSSKLPSQYILDVNI
jgi:hypothetical protein